MTAHQKEVARAHDALLDAVNEVSVHDRSEETRSVQEHVGDILRLMEFAVIDDSIEVRDDFHHASAMFVIGGKQVKVAF